MTKYDVKQDDYFNNASDLFIHDTAFNVTLGSLNSNVFERANFNRKSHFLLHTKLSEIELSYRKLPLRGLPPWLYAPLVSNELNSIR